MSIVYPEPLCPDQPQQPPRRSSDPLCSNCRGLEDEIISNLRPVDPVERLSSLMDGVTFEVKYNFDAMEEGAANGCPCCCLLRFGVYDVLARVPKHSGRSRMPADRRATASHNNPASAGESLKLYMASDSREGTVPPFLTRLGVHVRDRPVKFALCLDDKVESAAEPFAPTFFPDLQLVSSLVRDWRSRCDSSHGACTMRPGPDLDSHPKRLVKTSSDGMKLMETCGKHFEYVALSYCWGRQSQKACKKSNVDRLRHGIHPEDVSATVIDAIRIAEAIDYQFIWIDALCIVQDDPEEWAIEARKMQSIYENAALTIAASGVADSSCSLLAPREEARYPLRPFQLAGSTLYLQKPRSNRRPWRSRAWTMQEEVLSRRILYWDTCSLVWQCMEGEFHEWGYDEDAALEEEEPHRQWPRQVLKWSTGHVGITRRWRRAVKRGPIRHSEGRISAYAAWHSAREDYLSRSISLPQDWPLAIRGLADIAQKMQPNDPLIWGIWKSEFVEELAGWGYTALVAGRIPQGHEGMPSWSWFSQLGHSRAIFRHLDDLPQLGLPAARKHPSPPTRVVASCVAILPEDQGPFPQGAVAHLRGRIVEDWVRCCEGFREEQAEIDAHAGESKIETDLPGLPPDLSRSGSPPLDAELQWCASFLPLKTKVIDEESLRRRGWDDLDMEIECSRCETDGILIAKKGNGINEENMTWEVVKPGVKLTFPREKFEELEGREQQDIMLV